MSTSSYILMKIQEIVFFIVTIFFIVLDVYGGFVGKEKYEKLLKKLPLPLTPRLIFVLAMVSVSLVAIAHFVLFDITGKL